MCDLKSGKGRCGHHLRKALSSLKASEETEVLKAAGEAGVNIPAFSKDLSEDEAQTVKDTVRNDPNVRTSFEKSNDAKRALLQEQNKYALALSSKHPMVVAQYLYESADVKGKDKLELKALDEKRDVAKSKVDEIYKDYPYSPDYINRIAKIESNFKKEEIAMLYAHRQKRHSYIQLGHDALENSDPNTLKFTAGPKAGKYPSKISELRSNAGSLEKKHEDNVNLANKREAKKIVIQKRVDTLEYQSFKEKHFRATARGREYHGKVNSLMKEFVQTKSYRNDLEKKIERFDSAGRDSAKLKELLAKANSSKDPVKD